MSIARTISGAFPTATRDLIYRLILQVKQGTPSRIKLVIQNHSTVAHGDQHHAYAYLILTAMASQPASRFNPAFILRHTISHSNYLSRPHSASCVLLRIFNFYCFYYHIQSFYSWFIGLPLRIIDTGVLFLCSRRRTILL
ncbi:uncharacterized protein TrAtP1_002317 [Trichoderma atroviride]|uniref:uncharacterized protein n=1 Tax=Hypocrea atroviridis TaxID=63577 RepID=UPI00331B0624|nr:hypothetical protein TrAtP1_002317 [Trichoderma atroviride]